MSWQAVARKDFRDAARSWWLWGLSVIFVVFFTASAYFFTGLFDAALQQRRIDPTATYVRILTNVTTIIVPLTAIVVAYASVVGERESGTLKLLLSLPHSRADVVVGKVVGRGAVVAVPVLLGFLVAAIVFPLTSVALSPVAYVGFAILTALLGVVFVAIAVGVSAAASTNRRAVLGSVGIYVLFTLLWNQLVNSSVNRLARELELETLTYATLQLLLKHLNPTQAYKSLSIRLVVETPVQARVGITAGLRQRVYLQLLNGKLPVYLSDPVVLLILLLWLVVPVALGYYVFEGADL